MGSTGEGAAGNDLPPHEFDAPAGGALTSVAAPVAASNPVIPDNPSIWSKERFSSMRTKTCLMFGIAVSLSALPDLDGVRVLKVGVHFKRMQKAELAKSRGGRLQD